MLFMTQVQVAAQSTIPCSRPLDWNFIQDTSLKLSLQLEKTWVHQVRYFERKILKLDKHDEMHDIACSMHSISSEMACSQECLLLKPNWLSYSI